MYLGLGLQSGPPGLFPTSCILLTVANYDISLSSANVKSILGFQKFNKINGRLALQPISLFRCRDQHL